MKLYDLIFEDNEDSFNRVYFGGVWYHYIQFNFNDLKCYVVAYHILNSSTSVQLYVANDKRFDIHSLIQPDTKLINDKDYSEFFIKALEYMIKLIAHLCNKIPDDFQTTLVNDHKIDITRINEFLDKHHMQIIENGKKTIYMKDYIEYLITRES